MHRTIAVTFAFCLAAAGLSLPAQTQPPTEPPAQPQLPLPPPPPATTAAPAPDDGVVFVGAGDIANCELLGGARATAALLDTIPGTIFTLGDHAYPNGSAKDYKECYEPTWGRFKDRTHPVMGNHDLITAKGLPYWEYWGTRGGPEKRGYYSYELGAWRICVSRFSADQVAIMEARKSLLLVVRLPTARKLAPSAVPTMNRATSTSSKVKPRSA